MAKAELGTKRIDPETGRKFYDLNKDPVVSPYTGKSYPRSYFEEGKISAVEEDEEVAEKELDTEEEEGAEIVSLEEADEETKAGGDDLPDLGEDEDVDLGEDEDDTFLADEEEEDDDVADMIGVGDDDDEV
ncbi:TIGR02300 family protein [Mesorhizobium sp. B1-1-8]|uniref:TIGR02300 family protein n=1 Tax=Mesorhizobium sp. B1-1-8 TaxID=2589976 RepID=UPI00112EEBD4|nr:TIGR02300 family protein [Mesorhizobium sp. B1-1-8]UCI07752.1 TIGR02300 family protein [Mesorhizobium sp. B1-1-8]